MKFPSREAPPCLSRLNGMAGELQKPLESEGLHTVFSFEKIGYNIERRCLRIYVITVVDMIRSNSLQKAAGDLRYLLNQGYPKKAALELVGNRYQLTFDQRHLLHRGVFSASDSTSRQKRKIPIHRIRGHDLAIDGYNVLITIEAGLSGRPLVLGDDGFIRDISGLSGNFKKTERTETALHFILSILKRLKPRRTLFLFDSPISKSGELAQEVREWLIKENLLGDAVAVRVPEKILIGFPGMIATSDTAIIDQSKNVVDLAGYIIMNLPLRRTKPGATYSIVRWRRKRDPDPIIGVSS